MCPSRCIYLAGDCDVSWYGMSLDEYDNDTMGSFSVGDCDVSWYDVSLGGYARVSLRGSTRLGLWVVHATSEQILIQVLNIR